MILQSIITCPYCGGSKEETMPVDACLYFYPCTHCGRVLRPRERDCCVFCSYGAIRCPSMQAEAEPPAALSGGD